MFFFQHCSEANLIFCYCRGSSRIWTKCQWRGKIEERKYLPCKYPQSLDPHKSWNLPRRSTILLNSERADIVRLPYCTVYNGEHLNCFPKGMNATCSIQSSEDSRTCSQLSYLDLEKQCTGKKAYAGKPNFKKNPTTQLTKHILYFLSLQTLLLWFKYCQYPVSMCGVPFK